MLPAHAALSGSVKPVVGTWALDGIDLSGHAVSAAGEYGGILQGLLTIDADGNYQILRCQGHPRDRESKQSPTTPTACDGKSQGGYAHSGRVQASASTIRFQVDHSSVKALGGNELSTQYPLDGKQLAFAFDSTQRESSAGMQGTFVWHRVPDSLPALLPSEECRLRDRPTLDRSAITEPRVGQ